LNNRLWKEFLQLFLLESIVFLLEAAVFVLDEEASVFGLEEAAVFGLETVAVFGLEVAVFVEAATVFED
jgi:hypothetical protein